MADEKDNRPWRGGGDTTIPTIGQNIVVAINELVRVTGSASPHWVAAPANSTASGVAGTMAFSGTATTSAYLYCCIVGGSAGNATWGRLLLTTSF